MKKIIALSIIAVLAPLFVAKGAETETQKLERMLAAFNEPSIVRGALLVSFETNIGHDAAKSILKGFNLSINTTQVCSGEVSPGQAAQQNTSCTTVEEWDENLHLASVAVPEGKEKELAEKLYNHKDIIWVEPSYTATVAGNGSIGGDANTGDRVENTAEPTAYNTGSEEKGIENRTVLMGAGVLVVVALATWLFKRKAS